MQLKIYWHGGVGGWMKCKIRLKLSQLGCSWGLAELGKKLRFYSCTVTYFLKVDKKTKSYKDLWY